MTTPAQQALLGTEVLFLHPDYQNWAAAQVSRLSQRRGADPALSGYFEFRVNEEAGEDPTPYPGLDLSQTDTVRAFRPIEQPTGRVQGRRSPLLLGTPYRPYRVQNGALVVPVAGVLLHRFPFAFEDMATGFDYIVDAVSAGAKDPDVDRIILDIHSPGGTVAGTFAAARAIREATKEKPVIAVANESAYSAAYALASAASQIVVAESGGVGSIGVITAHYDYSRMLDQAGITPTLIYAGDRKADGAREKPLSDEARKRFQERVDQLHDQFTALVAENRGLTARAVKDTEAGVYSASESIEIGLADVIGDLDSVLSASAVSLTPQEEDQMSKDNESAVPKAAHEEAVVAATKQGYDEGLRAGAAAERERIQAILNLSEAEGRTKAAAHLAFKTDWNAEQAAAFLADLPKEAPKAEAPKATNPFEEAMAKSGNPEVGALEDDAMSQQSFADQIFASIGYGRRN